MGLSERGDRPLTILNRSHPSHHLRQLLQLRPVDLEDQLGLQDLVRLLLQYRPVDLEDQLSL